MSLKNEHLIIYVKTFTIKNVSTDNLDASKSELKRITDYDMAKEAEISKKF